MRESGPSQYEMRLLLPQRYACRRCGKHVVLLGFEALPPRWRAVVSNNGCRYECPRCAGEEVTQWTLQ